ncbi:sialidase family protein [Riemerella anatipestifer]|uniref:sialidase family protein n=1 Tax=Riemerella anatipestifer TaxID=34085 RepID=UPI00069BEDD7|nr:IPT/TIG domain-containing protein [Riemerella anatipestifer]
MAKKVLNFKLVLILIILVSCSRNDEITNESQLLEEVKDVIITSYSKNYAYSGEEVIIYGENFPIKEKCKILFDDVYSEILNVSKDSRQITIKVPNVARSIPTLKFIFENRNVVNNITNDYNKNIAVINKSIGNWTSTESAIFISDNDYIRGIQIKNNGKIYYNVSKRTYSSPDDGITWKVWYNSSFLSDFHATDNDEGFADSGFGLGKVPKGGSPLSLNIFFTTDSRTSEKFATVFVENDMRTGLLVTTNRNVYKTSDGENFVKVYNSGSTKIDIQRAPFKLDYQNIWTIGYDQAIETGLIFYCNGNNENWHSYLFTAYPKSMVNNIYFVNDRVGYCSLYTFDANPKVKMFKSLDGGASWNLINDIPNAQRNISMVFINESIGYVSSDNQIFLTKDGGNTWSLDFTADENIQKLGYSNNCVYALTNGKINRKFLK